MPAILPTCADRRRRSAVSVRERRYLRCGCGSRECSRGRRRRRELCRRNARRSFDRRCRGIRPDRCAWARTSCLQAARAAAKFRAISRFRPTKSTATSRRARRSRAIRYVRAVPTPPAKPAADLLVFAYDATYGVPVLVTRGTQHLRSEPVSREDRPALRYQPASTIVPVPVYGDGLQIRDWLYVEDHARAILHVLEHGALGERLQRLGRDAANES